MADGWPPNIHFSTEASVVKVGPVWTDPKGVTHGELDFTPLSDIVFHSPQSVRDMMAVLSDLAAAMEAEAARAAAEEEHGDG